MGEWRGSGWARHRDGAGALMVAGLVSVVAALSGSRLEAQADAAPEADGRALEAGAHAIDVTPEHFPIRTNGGIAEKFASRVHSHLSARAVVLRRGDAMAAIAVVDSCLLDRAFVDGIRDDVEARGGIPADRILIAATHTHSAPAVTSIHGTDPGPTELAYRRLLARRVADAILRAESNLETARAAWGAARCDDHVFCRRWLMKPGTAFSPRFTGVAENRAQMNPGHDNEGRIRPTGEVDPEVTVLSLVAADGRPIALLANYSTHYVGAPEISSDYFGAFAAKIGARLAPGSSAAGPGESASTPAPFVGILCNGTSGDANCVDFSRPPQAFDVESVSERIAGIVHDLWKTLDHREAVDLGFVEEQVSFRIRKPSADEVAAARTMLAEEVGDRPVRTWDENYARETVLLSESPDERELRLQAVRIGGLGITATPCEVYGATGLAVKEASPFEVTMNIGLANGYEGYLPPPEQFPLGGYTTWRARTSLLPVDAEPRIRERLAAMLTALHRGGSGVAAGTPVDRTVAGTPRASETSGPRMDRFTDRR